MNKFVRTLLSLCAVPFLFSCGAKGDSDNKEGKLQYQPQQNIVEVMTLRRTDFQQQILSNGTLSAVRKAALCFPSGGVLSGVYAANGQRVSRGAVLARLDRGDLALSLRSAELAMEKAELDLLDVLAGQGYAVSDTASVPAEVMKVAQMRSGYASARNALSRARFDMAGAALTAPFSGRVADLQCKQFDRVGSEPFCTLVDDSAFDVDFSAMEGEYASLQPGLEVRVYPFGSDAPVEGKITSVNPLIDKNGQVAVRARIAGAAGLVDGMHVRVIVQRSVPGQLVVPKSAVVIRDNLDVLFTYTDDGKAHWTYVNILASNADSHVVIANVARGARLEEGDRVIVSGNLNLADESEVVLAKP